MTPKRPANSPEYAVSNEAAAYIADALMEFALQFEATHFAQIRRHYQCPNVTTALGNSTRSATIRPSERCSLVGSILWFDPRREHSSAPTVNSRSRRAQGLSRLAASFAATRRAWP
jgi:hypothetical protein